MTIYRLLTFTPSPTTSPTRLLTFTPSPTSPSTPLPPPPQKKKLIEIWNNCMTSIFWAGGLKPPSCPPVAPLYPNLVIFTFETSVEFVIFFLFLQPQPLQIHLSPANLTTVIHSTLASHKQISTNFNAFKIHWHASLHTLQNINTSHQHSKNYTGFNQTKNWLQTLSSHIQNTYKSTTYISLQQSFISVTFCFYKIFRFTRSFHSISALIITRQKGFLCHWSTTLEFTTSLKYKFIVQFIIILQILYFIFDWER